MSGTAVLQKIKLHKDRLFFIGIGVLFLATRLFLLTSVPRGLHVDEAAMAYSSFCLSEYGVDRYGNWHPVYLTNFDGGQSAMYPYLCAACMKVIGYCTTAFRLPAVFGGGLVLVFGYLIGKETLGKQGGMLAALLVVLCPYFIMASRWGLDCNLLLGFSTMSIYWLIFAVKKEAPWAYSLAGASFGLTLYTYALSYILLPVFLFLSFLYLLWSRKLNIKKILAFALPFALLALPLLLFLAVNNGLLEPFRTPLFSVQRLEKYRGGEVSFQYILDNLDTPFMLLTEDWLPYNAFKEYGTLYYISVPFLLAGIVLSLVRTAKSIAAKTYDGQTFMAIMFWAALVLSMAVMAPNINKSNAIYFPAVYLAVLAFDYVLKKCGKWKKWFFGGVACAYFLCFLAFGNYYYFRYPQEVYPQWFFDDTVALTLDVIESEYPGGMEKTIYIENKYDEAIHEPSVYTLVRKPIPPEEFLAERGLKDSYGHYRFYFQEEDEELDMDGIYMIYWDMGTLQRLTDAGFTARECGYWWIVSR